MRKLKNYKTPACVEALERGYRFRRPPTSEEIKTLRLGLGAERETHPWKTGDFLCALADLEEAKQQRMEGMPKTKDGRLQALRAVAREHARLTGDDYHDCMRCASVADAYPPEQRDTPLDFRAYAEVHGAGLSAEAGAALLKQAHAEGHGVSWIRAAIRSKVEDGSDQEPSIDDGTPDGLVRLDSWCAARLPLIKAMNADELRGIAWRFPNALFLLDCLRATQGATSAA